MPSETCGSAITSSRRPGWPACTSAEPNHVRSACSSRTMTNRRPPRCTIRCRCTALHDPLPLHPDRDRVLDIVGRAEKADPELHHRPRVLRRLEKPWYDVVLVDPEDRGRLIPLRSVRTEDPFHSGAGFASVLGVGGIDRMQCGDQVGFLLWRTGQTTPVGDVAHGRQLTGVLDLRHPREVLPGGFGERADRQPCPGAELAQPLAECAAAVLGRARGAGSHGGGLPTATPSRTPCGTARYLQGRSR